MIIKDGYGEILGNTLDELNMLDSYGDELCVGDIVSYQNIKSGLLCVDILFLDDNNKVMSYINQDIVDDLLMENNVYIEKLEFSTNKKSDNYNKFLNSIGLEIEKY